MEGFGRSSSGSGGGGKKKQVMGKIRLDVPVKSREGEEIIIEVLLHPKFYPGGTYAMNRVGSEMVNDKIPCCLRSLKTISDGKCKAVPTKYEPMASLQPEGWTPDESIKPASFPTNYIWGLVKNNPELFKGDANDIKDGGRAQLEVGMEVKGTIELEEPITIQKRDASQTFPSIAKLLDYVSSGKYGDEATTKTNIAQNHSRLIQKCPVLLPVRSGSLGELKRL
eukprot:scaffold249339_cov49-Cyclotella_meneghiniana.AAC.1